MSAYTPMSKYRDLLADCNRKTDLEITNKLDLRVQKLEAIAENIEKQSSQTQKILDRCEIDLTKQAKQLKGFFSQIDDLKGKTFLQLKESEENASKRLDEVSEKIATVEQQLEGKMANFTTM
jgi:DNA-binding ferritin-like protein